jgi:hypothetical protein
LRRAFFLFLAIGILLVIFRRGAAFTVLLRLGARRATVRRLTGFFRAGFRRAAFFFRAFFFRLGLSNKISLIFSSFDPVVSDFDSSSRENQQRWFFVFVHPYFGWILEGVKISPYPIYPLVRSVDDLLCPACKKQKTSWRRRQRTRLGIEFMPVIEPFNARFNFGGVPFESLFKFSFGCVFSCGHKAK